MTARLPAPPAHTGYVHTRTFFQHNRWDAHDHIGALMARGITQIATKLDGDDWVVSWAEAGPPNVIKNAEETPA